MRTFWLKVVPWLLLAGLLGLAFLLTGGDPAMAESTGVAPLPPVIEPDGFAGVCYAHYYGPGDRPFLPLAYDAGARHDRIDFRWDTISTVGYEQGYDPLVDDELAAGIDLIGILMATPASLRKPGCNPTLAAEAGIEAVPGQRPPGWYVPELGAAHSLSAAASDPGACPPSGLNNPWTPSDFNGNHWAEFVYNTVQRYRGRVRYWEMWNEPEWEWFWLGSDSEYAQLLKVGYQATKAACPDCMVLFSGLHYWADPTFFERVLDILNDDPAALANNYFFDVMSVHFYSRSSNAYDMVNHIRTRMTTYVPDHPIWLTETGVPVWNDASVDPTPEKYDYAATMNEAAAYVIQSYANARASGVERYHFFRTHDESMGEYFGLIRNDLTLRPAYTAYQVATTYFITPTFTTRVQTGSHVRVTLWGTPRGKVTVLWNESPSSSLHTLAATLDTATLVDRRGSTETVSAVGGEFAIPLAGATANLRSNPSDYIIGGEPVIVVETEAPNEPPISTILPLPEVTYIPSFTVSWQGQDNQAGVWRFDVQVRDGVDGEWQYVWHSTAATSGQFSGEDGHTYFFRARAMDRIGNQEDWPVEPQAHTALDLFTTLHLRVGAFFADENRNDVWDLPVTATNEITLTSVSLRLLDPAGRDVVSPEIGDSWRVTTTVSRGTTYELWAIGDDNMRMQQLPVPAGEEAYTYSRDSLGLWPVTRTYLPLVARDG